MTTRRRERGATLVEGLVALAVLSLGLVATVRLQGWLRAHSDLAHERSLAVQQAQQLLERARDTHDAAAFDREPEQTQAMNAPTATLQLQQTSAHDEGLRTDRVTVRWHDRHGHERRLELASALARLRPVYSALLALPPQDRLLATARVLPAATRTFADGRRVVRPSAESRIAWIVDGASGEIVQQCEIAAAAALHALSADDLRDCEPFVARLVHGHVRFALSAAPDPLRANDTPLPLSVQAGDARCDSERLDAGGERALAYACALPRATGDDAARRLQFVPQGWALGLTADANRICRYPGAARAPLNFLVVRGDLDCPGGVAGTPETPHNGSPVVTVQHQP